MIAMPRRAAAAAGSAQASSMLPAGPGSSNGPAANGGSTAGVFIAA